MKKMLFAAVMMSLLLVMSGCGGGGNDVVVVLDSPPPSFKTSIPSNPAFDGDILNGSTVSLPNSPSVFAGIDPLTPYPYDEYRAFLEFPLTNGVRDSAYIDAATLDIIIDSITIHPSAGSIPIRIELVPYPLLTLQPADYDRNFLPLIFTTKMISSVGHVRVDVTLLMREAHARGLANFQIRILEDYNIRYPGLIEINDTNAKAPFLEVVYH